MTVVSLGKDERYPVPYISEYSWGTDVDVPQPLVDRWHKVDEEWHEVAGQLLDLLEAEEKRQKLLRANETGQQSIGFEVRN